MFLSAVLLFRDAYLALGQFEESLGHYSEALSYYSRMLQLQSTDKQILVRQGICLRAVGRDGDALASFQAALAVDPTYAEARLNVSFLLAAKGDLGKAREELQVTARFDRNIDLGPIVPRVKKKKSPFHKAQYTLR